MDRNLYSLYKDKRRAGKASRKKGFAQPRQVEDHWNFYKKELYIARPGRGWPAWLIPLLALVVILAIVFWAAPAAINRYRALHGSGQTTDPGQSSLLYLADTWTTGKAVADVFDRDDLKASRLSQVLYNEPVRILSTECAYGFAQVRLQDGLEGYMLLDDLVDSRDSIEPDLFDYKLVVAATSKRIMSHASKGTLLVEVMLGTVLFADYRGSGIFRVRLPDGQYGWLSEDGVIVLQPLASVSIPADGARYFCTSAMAFNQVTLLPNGQSIRGISTTGIARLAALVNGVSLPRTLASQAASGQPVSLVYNEETGLCELDRIEAGDLVFLALASDSDEVGDLAICVGADLVLYARPGQSSIRLIDLTQNEDLWRRIVGVRRLYAG